MRFTIISETGYGLGIATHLSSEGHSVSLCLNRSCELGQGIVNTEASSTPADITIYDSDLFGKWADEQRKAGNRVLGASHWAEMLEKDKGYAQDVIRVAGWDMTEVNKGTNLYITTWFNGSHFIATYASLVYNRLMSSGAGPDVRHTGVVSNFQQPTDKVYQEILKPLEPILRRTNHRGCCHIYVVTDQDKYSVKNISASFNTPLALVLFENSRPAVSDILLRLFNESSRPIQILEPWAAAVMLSVPPYPYQTKESHKYQINGLQTPALKHLWFVDVQRSGDNWTTAGVSGKLGYVTSRGGYIPAKGNYTQEAIRRAYRTIENLDIKDLQYRDDIGRRLNKLIDNLRSTGWMK